MKLWEIAGKIIEGDASWKQWQVFLYLLLFWRLNTKWEDFLPYWNKARHEKMMNAGIEAHTLRYALHLYHQAG